jgi:large subunit ribosomal protein L22
MLGILKKTKKGALMMETALKSAVSNFQNSEEGAAISKDAMTIKEVQVMKGPMIKRIQPRAQGRAFRIQKKLSHVSIVIAN